MELLLLKEDIYKIGDVVVIGDNIGVVIKATDENCGIKEILLRNVLKTFGEEYYIVSIDDYSFQNKNDISTLMELVFVTNLPFELVEKLGDIY